MPSHNNRDHALLSASGASRWINCTPSARLEEEVGKPESSVYAKEGTVAHELGEIYILHDLGRLDEQSFNTKFEEIMANELFNEEMLEVVPIYTDYCLSEYKAAMELNNFATIEVEQKLDLTEFVPESFGTADCVIINDDVMEVIDLKYGKGVPVYAEGNKQEMLYGLGALRKFDTIYDIKEIKLTIVQPRINNISTWQISVDDLLAWANTDLKKAANLAFEGNGEFKAGAWCKFCAAKGRCKALANENLALAKHEFANPNLLSNDEIAEILKKLPQFNDWANSISEYAKVQALQGEVFSGFKLVEGLSRRKWKDEEAAAKRILITRSDISEDQLYDMKFKTLTQIERLLGKKAFSEILSDMIIKPQGAPILVPVSDRRPALDSSEAINDFK